MTKPPPTGRAAAIEALKRQIAEQRARLDPDVLKRAARAAELSQKPAAEREAGLVPYDRDAAAEAVRLFLEAHPDSAGFKRALHAFLERKKPQ